MHTPSSRQSPRYHGRMAPLALALRLAFAGLAASTLAIAPVAAQTATIAQQIPAGPLSAALHAYAAKAGITLSFEESLTSGLNTQGLQGHYGVQQGLNKLLEGSGLEALPGSKGHNSWRLRQLPQLAPQGTATLAPVVVTGEKMVRRQQDTTTAVTVFQTLKIEDDEHHSIYELAREVPNTTRNAAGGINIRGAAGSGPAIGVFSFISGARPRISTSIDGVAETWAGQQYLDVGLWDVEQIEVLRGPQSTLQGRNAIAGAMIVKSKDPSFTWEGAARLSAEDKDGRSYLAGVLSGPIVADELAFRLSAEGATGHGFIDYKAAFPWDPAELDNHTVRGKLLWRPGSMPDFKAKLTVVNRKYTGEYLNRIETPCSSAACDNEKDMFAERAFFGFSSYTRRQNSDSTVATLDTEYRFNDALTAHLQYSHGKDDLHFEESGAARFYLDQNQDSNTLEGRLVFDPPNGRLKGVAGLYYFDRHQELTAADLSAVTFDGTDKVRTSAAYGEATLGVSDSVDIIAGARLERETQRRNLDAWPGTPWAGLVTTNKGETMLLPKLGVQYKLPGTTLGLTARKGYNPGGGGLDWFTSVFYEYDKEEVMTYEASSRSMFLDNRLSLNATVFYNRYKGYQALFERRLINIAKGHSHGLELDAAARVSNALTLYGSLGLLDTEVKEGGAYGAALVGKQFDAAPHLTANLGFKQKFNTHWFVSGNVSYTGKYYTGIDNDTREQAGDYVLTNLQAGYDRGRYAIRAYIKNLFNEKVIYAKNINWEMWPGSREIIVGDVGAPRTVGVVLDIRY